MLPEIVEVPEELKKLMPEKKWIKSLTYEEKTVFDRWFGGTYDVMKEINMGKIPVQYAKDPKMIKDLKG